MAVALLGNVAGTAARWNELFSEADRKISSAMDNKSPLMCGTTGVLGWFGKVFLFANGSRRQSAFLSITPYDHSIFTAAAASEAATVIDATNKIVALTGQIDTSYYTQAGVSTSGRLLDSSLEAHTTWIDGVKYWILESGFRPEKRYRYALAEIVFDGLGYDSFQWQPNWDKYNFFRFHNLNSYSITVTFPNGHTLTIPRWSCKSTRRHYETGVFTDGWNYLNRCVSGDYRIFEQTQGNDTPWRSCGANNVCSPAIIYKMFESFRGQYGLGGDSTIPGPKIKFDAHHVYNVSSLYTGIYPSVTLTTKLGDLLHHRGRIIDKRVDGSGNVTTREITFSGYDAMKSRWPALGIDVTENGDGTITLSSNDGSAVTHDLWGIGTNLFQQSADHTPGCDIITGYTLDNHAPTGVEVFPIIPKSVTISHTYRDLNEDGSLGSERTVPIVVNYARYLSPSEGTFGQDWSLHSDNVSAVTSLDKFGASEYPGQSTAYGHVEDRSLTLTPFGLVLRWSVRVSLGNTINYPYTGSDGGQKVLDGSTVDLTENDHISLDGTDLVFARSVTFTGYGWPTTSNPAFSSPRINRRVESLPSKTVLTYDITDAEAQTFGPYRHHPDVEDEPIGKDGSDSRAIPLTSDRKRAGATDIAVLTPLTLSDAHVLPTESPFDRQVYACPDTLQELLETPDSSYSSARARLLANQTSTFRRVRMTAIREHYNALATYINAHTKARPFTFFNFRYPFGETLISFTPNALGLYGGPVFPATQFAQIDKDSQLERAYVSLGVPVKTESDFPSSYSIAKNTNQTLVSNSVSWSENTSVETYEDFKGGFQNLDDFRRWTLRVEQQTQGVQLLSRQVSNTSILSSSVFNGAVGELGEYRWISVSDLKSVAESLGFKFHFQRVGVPYILRTFTATTSDITINTNPTATVFRELISIKDFAGLDSSGNAIYEYRPSPSIGLKTYNFQTSLVFETGSYSHLVQVVEGETAEWMSSISLPKLTDYRAGDYPCDVVSGLINRETMIETMETEMVVRYKFRTSDDPNSAYRLYREIRDSFNQATLHNLPTGWNTRLGVQNNGTIWTPSLLVQDFASSGLERNSVMVMNPTPRVEHTTSEWSSGSYKNALGRSLNGPVVIPLKEAS